MTSTGHTVVARHHARLRISPGSVVAGARRAVREHRVLAAAAVVVLCGCGVAGGVVALNSSSAFQSAAPCPGATSYVYAVPSYPARPAPAPAWPPPQGNYWGWMPRPHALEVGNWVRVDTGGLWKITAIAALPNDCQSMALSPPVTTATLPAWRLGGSVSGSLVLQPVRQGPDAGAVGWASVPE